MFAMGQLIRMFTSPASVYDDVREGRASWIVPTVFYVVLTVVAFALIMTFIGFENLMTRSLKQNPDISAEQKARMREVMTSPATRAVTMAMAPIGSLTTLLVIAGFVTGVAALLDRRPGFGKMLATTAYTLIPFGIVGVALSAIVLSLLDDPTQADPQHLVMFSPAAFLTRESVGAFLFALLAGFDVLVLAQIGLLAYGVTRVAGRLSFGAVFGSLLGAYLAWTLIRAGMAAVLPS